MYCLEFRNAGEFKEAKEVRYQERFELPLSGHPDLTFAFYFYKTPKWQREEELRIVGRRSPVGYILFNPSLLARVIVGSKMSAEHQEIVRGWAQLRSPQLTVSDASEMELH